MCRLKAETLEVRLQNKAAAAAAAGMTQLCAQLHHNTAIPSPPHLLNAAIAVVRRHVKSHSM
jgi:hypothetical protein